MSTRPGVIITGGAKRVGAALSLHLAAQGYDIALHYNHSRADAEIIKAEVEKLGTKCELFALDLQDAKAIPTFMESIKKAMPNCTSLINNASVFERSTLMETTEALFDRQMEVNFKAPFFLTQAFARTFKKGGVMNVIDTDIGETQGGYFAYLLSKKVLADFTEMAARELAPNIRVNGMCPGCLIPADANDAAYVGKLKDIIPLKAHPTLDEFLRSLEWLLTQSHITGQLLYIDGGKHVL
jgi:pteridine reductase